MIDEDGWPDVSCALPDLKWVIWTALGAGVVVAALAVWAVRKLRMW